MQLWTYEHFYSFVPSLIAMIIITWLLRIWLIKKDIKIRIIPLQIIAIFLLILEVLKQGTSIIEDYDLYYLPFHFCSLFLFLLPAMSFYWGQHKEVVDSITATCELCVFLFMIVYPALIYGAGDIQNFFNFERFYSFHTVTYHTLVVFVMFLIIGLDLHVPSEKRYYKQLWIFIICFSIIAAIMSQIFKTNYGGFYECNVAPIEDIRQELLKKIPYFWAHTLYLTVFIILHILFVSGVYSLYIFIQNLFTKFVRKPQPQPEIPTQQGGLTIDLV